MRRLRVDLAAAVVAALALVAASALAQPAAPAVNPCPPADVITTIGAEFAKHGVIGALCLVLILACIHLYRDAGKERERLAAERAALAGERDKILLLHVRDAIREASIPPAAPSPPPRTTPPRGTRAR